MAMASAARTRGIILRHEGQHQLAEQITLQAAERIARAGLTSPARAYAQMLATTSYNYALGNERDRALEMIADAAQAVGRLPEPQPHPWSLSTRFSIDRPQVTLYEVGVRWALGDAGEALAAGHELHPAMFPTPERRARLHTDMARAACCEATPNTPRTGSSPRIPKHLPRWRDGLPFTKSVSDFLIQAVTVIDGESTGVASGPDDQPTKVAFCLMISSSSLKSSGHSTANSNSFPGTRLTTTIAQLSGFLDVTAASFTTE
ncbi:hypothetical protein [Actinomadura sp. 9N215]|uniref:hypothetical protein n=1 Tax=Actinomadura sp. 9N215 TaxID=3375150 RepID=UPI00379A4541